MGVICEYLTSLRLWGCGTCGVCCSVEQGGHRVASERAGKGTARWCVIPEPETLRNHRFVLSLARWRCAGTGCVFPVSEARPSAGPRHRLVLLLARVCSPIQLKGCLGCDGDLKAGLEHVIYVDFSCSYTGGAACRHARYSKACCPTPAVAG